MKTHFWIGAAVVVAAIPLLALLVIALSSKQSPPPSNDPPAQSQAAHVPPVRKVIPRPVKPGPSVAAATREEFVLPPAHVWGREASIGEFTVRAVNRYWAGPAPEVLTLGRAIESGACVIRESGHLREVSAEVTGARPVLALVGDMLVGGRQDRLVASSNILEPGQNTIEVFSAELQRKPEDLQHADLFHDFAAPQVDLNVKAAVFLDGSQPGVSLAIAQVSGAYRSYRETIVGRGAAVDELVTQARRIVWAFTVGFVVYKGDRLIAADLFESTVVLEQSADNLLRSYAMTAVYGDVSNWTAESPLPGPSATPVRLPNNLDAPRLRHIVTDEELVRRECRRTPSGRPIHTAIFRK